MASPSYLGQCRPSKGSDPEARDFLPLGALGEGGLVLGDCHPGGLGLQVRGTKFTGDQPEEGQLRIPDPVIAEMGCDFHGSICFSYLPQEFLFKRLQAFAGICRRRIVPRGCDGPH